MRSRFGEVCYCCCLPALPGPAWVLLNYVLQNILCTSTNPASVLYLPQVGSEIRGPAIGGGYIKSSVARQDLG